MVETASEEENKVERMKRTEDSLRDPWDNIKHTNTRIIGVPEEEEKKKWYEKIFEEITVEKFPNMEKEIVKLPEKEFRIMIVKMIKNLENKMEKMQESINKDLEELKNKHANNKLLKLKIL